MRLVLATRRSMLALAQSRAFARALEAAVPGLTVDELQVVTSGDTIQDRSLQEVGGKGLFVKELEEALIDRRADFAVHSINDVPAEVAPGCALVCIPPREDPRDVLVTKTGGGLASLAPGARVGTSRLRRAVALLEARPELLIEPVRGNVDTRLRKVTEGPLDATVLALAGLKRLGLEGRASEVLSVEVSLPAIGQGALGIECREDDGATIDALRTMEDRETMLTVMAERAVMTAVEGSCKIPVAAYALHRGDTLWLRAMLADDDGSNVRRGERTIPWPSCPEESEKIGLELGYQLKGKKA